MQILPWGYALLRGADLHITPGRVLGAVVVLAAFVVGGGFVALVIGGATTPKHALAYGLAWQSLIGGFLKRPPRGGEQPVDSN